VQELRKIPSALPSLFPPSPVQGLAVTYPDSTSIRLAWSAPADNGGSAVLGYKVSAVNQDTGSPVYSSASYDTSPLTITSLTAGTAFTATVFAVNAIGQGSGSSIAATTQASAPGAPTSLSGTAGDSQAALSWTLPSSNGGAVITGYVIEYTPSGGSATTVSTGSAAALFTLSGLINGTAHSIRVAAVNSVGRGSYSSSVSVTPATVPGAPTALAATSDTDSAVPLAWTAPSSNGGASITSYVVEWTPSGGSASTVNTGSATASYTKTGLTNGTEYSFRVAAVNSAGQGAWSSSATATPNISYTSTAVMLTSGTSYTVPSGANSMKIWAVGPGGPPSWNGGGGGVGYRTFSCTGGSTITYSVGTNGGTTSVTYNGINIKGFGGLANGLSLLKSQMNPTYIYQFIANGGMFGGDVDGGAQGGRSRYADTSATSSGAVGQGGGGSDEYHDTSSETGTLTSCKRIPAGDVSGLFSALALAGVSTTETCGSTAAFGSGGFNYKYGTPKANGIGGGGINIDGNSSTGAVVIKFLGESVSNPARSYTPTAVLLTSGAQNSSIYGYSGEFNGQISDGFQTYTVPAGATTVKAWAVGGGGFPFAGGVSYMSWPVFGGQKIYYRVGASQHSSYVIGTRNRVAVGNAGVYRGQGSGLYSGGDGGAQGGQGTQYGDNDWGGSIGGGGSAQYGPGTNRVRKAPNDVSGLLAAVQLAGGPSDFGYGDYTEKYYNLAPGIGGSRRNGNGGQGCVVLYFT
jgi:hypothetical protein